MHESVGSLLLSKRKFPFLGTLLSKEKVSACGNGHVLAHRCGVHLRYIAAHYGKDKQKERLKKYTNVTRQDSGEGNVH
jgi:hypothetical protein